MIDEVYNKGVKRVHYQRICSTIMSPSDSKPASERELVLSGLFTLFFGRGPGGRFGWF